MLSMQNKDSFVNPHMEENKNSDKIQTKTVTGTTPR